MRYDRIHRAVASAVFARVATSPSTRDLLLEEVHRGQVVQTLRVRVEGGLRHFVVRVQEVK